MAVLILYTYKKHIQIDWQSVDPVWLDESEDEEIAVANSAHLRTKDFHFGVKGETAEQRKAVGAWLRDYAEHLQHFDEIKHRHTLNEVGDVAEGRYDWKIERGKGMQL